MSGKRGGAEEEQAAVNTSCMWIKLTRFRGMDGLPYGPPFHSQPSTQAVA